MGTPCSCTQFIKSRIFTQESVSVLQVTWESVSSTISHMCASERPMKSKVLMMKSLSPYVVPSYNGKKYHLFVAICIVTCAAHLQQYRQQQIRDIFWHSFVLWWYLYDYRKLVVSTVKLVCWTRGSIVSEYFSKHSHISYFRKSKGRKAH